MGQINAHEMDPLVHVAVVVRRIEHKVLLQVEAIGEATRFSADEVTFENLPVTSTSNFNQ